MSPPSVLPDISPTRGEIGSFDIFANAEALAIGETGNDSRSPPFVGEMSGRTEGAT